MDGTVVTLNKTYIGIVAISDFVEKLWLATAPGISVPLRYIYIIIESGLLFARLNIPVNAAIYTPELFIIMFSEPVEWLIDVP